jgi:hypothetical protein
LKAKFQFFLRALRLSFAQEKEAFFRNMASDDRAAKTI